MAKPKTASRKPPRRSRPVEQIGRRFEKLVEVQARLRAPGGCPWDREQTHQSLRPYLIEEAYEVLEALDGGSDERFASELGDLLLQVLFHSQLAREEGRFDIGDVVDAIREKLIRRHPHVFGNVRVRNSAEVLKRWEELKAEERRQEGRPESDGEDSVLGNVPRNLPALSEAFQLTRRASNVGFDWKRLEGVLDKLEEETRELRGAVRRARRTGAKISRRRRMAHAHVEEEAGDLLFIAANVARFLRLDPEIALKKANRKFQRRFQWMEKEARGRGEPLAKLSSAELEHLWNRAKAAGQD
ncbi:MAG TPA: nucleoside triphosphate pyrophosphohydrolase [Candidatus Dormibacteraeota bacterium]|nr:nucleoside triphosphate pyrophosphohydrolase [Candidatus Dormibacteraeota bacterium]